MDAEYESPFIAPSSAVGQQRFLEDDFVVLEEDDQDDSGAAVEEFDYSDPEISDDETDQDYFLGMDDDTDQEGTGEVARDAELDFLESEWDSLDDLEAQDGFPAGDPEAGDEGDDDEFSPALWREMQQERAFDVDAELEFDAPEDESEFSEDRETLDFDEHESTEDFEERADLESEDPDEADIEEPEDEASSLSAQLGLELTGVDEDELNDALDGQDYDAAVHIALEAGIENEDLLTDLVFLSEHPELIDQPELAESEDLEQRESIREAIIELQSSIFDRTRPITGLGGPLGLFRPSAPKRRMRARRRRRKKNPLRKFVCSSEDIKNIENALKQPAPGDKLRQDLLLAINGAAKKARLAARRLRRSNRNTVSQFRNSFNVPPRFVPKWRPAGATWNRGDVVRARLGRAAKVLESGRIKYYCWGPSSRRGLSWVPTSRTAHDPDEFAVFLGQGFWTDWMRGDLDSMEASLLINALALSYKTVNYTSKRSHFANGACYALFVFNAIGETPPERLLARCRQSRRHFGADATSSADSDSKKKDSVKQRQANQVEVSKETLDYLANICFFANHPELNGRPIKKREQRLAREWNRIRQLLKDGDVSGVPSTFSVDFSLPAKNPQIDFSKSHKDIRAWESANLKARLAFDASTKDAGRDNTSYVESLSMRFRNPRFEILMAKRFAEERNKSERERRIRWREIENAVAKHARRHLTIYRRTASTMEGIIKLSVNKLINLPSKNRPWSIDESGLEEYLQSLGIAFDALLRLEFWHQTCVLDKRDYPNLGRFISRKSSFPVILKVDCGPKPALPTQLPLPRMGVTRR